ncbi:hypothetical protein CWRG_01680 [Chthonomonas calidirosea]|nr:RAMP superfamily CRISPR-associated protein [Chthonomonas calidirosea]CEK16975.1 hypothetical protein CWRG_01680 [Chthonomonas calidirosea]
MPIPYSKLKDGHRPLAYFLFPFQGSSKDQQKEGYQDIAFDLTLEFPSERQQATERTIKAWIAFGGVGARTRRGCGALQVTEDALGGVCRLSLKADRVG